MGPPGSRPDSMTLPLARRLGLALQLEQIGLKQDHLDQLIDVLPGEGGDLDEDRIPAPIVRHQAFVLQLLADLQGVGVGMIHLVDGDDDRDFGGAGVVEGLQGLGHDAVVGGHDQHNDVGDVGAPGAHRTERRVARSVQEGDLRQFLLPLGVRKGNRVGPDMLGNAPGFPSGDVGLADDVQQSRLAVIDVAHDGYHRGARDQVGGFVLDIQFDLPERRMDKPAPAFPFLNLEPAPVLGANLLGEILVDGLVDVSEDAQFDQVGNNLEGFLLELLGQFAHDNGRLDRNDLGVGGQNHFGRRFGAFCRQPLRRGGQPGGAAAANTCAAHTAHIAAPGKIGLFCLGRSGGHLAAAGLVHRFDAGSRR